MPESEASESIYYPDDTSMGSSTFVPHDQSSNKVSQLVDEKGSLYAPSSICFSPKQPQRKTRQSMGNEERENIIIASKLVQSSEWQRGREYSMFVKGSGGIDPLHFSNDLKSPTAKFSPLGVPRQKVDATASSYGEYIEIKSSKNVSVINKIPEE